MTKVKLNGIRFVRSVETGLRPNTQYLGLMARTESDLKECAWLESSEFESELVINSPLANIAHVEKHDAFHQSTGAVSGSGTQNVVAGMAVYRIEIPLEASASFIDNVSFRLAADKFCVSGLKVAAILSDSSVPPTDWDLLRIGGAGNSTVAGFATVGTIEESVETLGVLAETAETVETSVNRSEVFNIDLSSETGSFDYLYLAVSLFDYQSKRREYWVEGCGLLENTSIEVEFDGDITISSTTDYPLLVAPINDITESSLDFNEWGSGVTIVEVKFPVQDTYDETKAELPLFTDKINIVKSGLFWRHGVPVMVSTGVPVTTDIGVIYYPTDDKGENAEIYMINSSGTLSFLTTVVRFLAPVKGFAGAEFVFDDGAIFYGSFNYRVTLVEMENKEDFPDLGDATIWNGTNDKCLGTVVRNAGVTSENIVLRRNIENDYIFMLLSFEKIATVDAAAHVVSASSIDLSSIVLRK